MHRLRQSLFLCLPVVIFLMLFETPQLQIFLNQHQNNHNQTAPVFCHLPVCVFPYFNPLILPINQDLLQTQKWLFLWQAFLLLKILLPVFETIIQGKKYFLFHL